MAEFDTSKRRSNIDEETRLRSFFDPPPDEHRDKHQDLALNSLPSSAHWYSCSVALRRARII